MATGMDGAPQAVVAIDLGGSKALAGVVEQTGEVRSRTLFPSREYRDNPGALLDRMALSVKEAMSLAEVPSEQIAAVGVCVPGPLDLARRVVDVAPNLGWKALNAKAELERRLPGLPVFLENDVRAAALAEHTLGAGRGHPSMLAIFVGTGVGGGLVIEDRLYHGSRGGAGEIGHIVIQADGPLCACGQRGCLESLAARAAVARYVAEQVSAGSATVLTDILHGNLAALTSRDLAKAIQQGDAVAVQAARRSAKYVGIAAGSMVNLLDPDAIVLGGGIVEAIDEQYVAWAAETAQQQILSERARSVLIVASQLGDDAGLLGAALTAFYGLAPS